MKDELKEKQEEEIPFEGEETLGREAEERLNKTGTDTAVEIYPDADVNIAPEPVSVFQLKRKYDKTPKPLLVLDPDYQRTGEVWKSRQKNELIESILMGIPLPVIYVKEDDNGVYIIVDGRQRLTAIFDFMNDEFKLKDLKILGSLNGNIFSKIDQKQQNKIEDCPLTLHVIKPPTSDRVTFDLFDRVNRGGTRLNNQEMRNALYQGCSTKLLNKLSKSDNFIKATENSISLKKRMKDRYLILRFLSFYLWRQKLLRDVKTDELVEYRSDLEYFLGKSMLYMNSDNNGNVIKQLEEIFEIAMKNCVGLFGTGCFRLPQEDSKTRKPINMALFETISYFCAILKDVSDEKSNMIMDKYKTLISDRDFIKSLTYTIDSNVSVYARFDKVERAAKEVLDSDKFFGV